MPHQLSNTSDPTSSNIKQARARTNTPLLARGLGLYSWGQRDLLFLIYNHRFVAWANKSSCPRYEFNHHWVPPHGTFA